MVEKRQASPLSGQGPQDPPIRALKEPLVLPQVPSKPEGVGDPGAAKGEARVTPLLAVQERGPGQITMFGEVIINVETQQLSQGGSREGATAVWSTRSFNVVRRWSHRKAPAG
jgi:hypothetical protein